jgi:hypothetical protein
MNLNEVGLNQIIGTVETETREVEFKPAGSPTGMFFELRHESAKEVQSMIKAFQTKVRNLTLKRKTTAYNNLVAEHEDQLRMAHVVGWRWEQGADEDAGRPEFSKKELNHMLNHDILGYHLKKFIDEEVGSLEDFLSKSDSN